MYTDSHCHLYKEYYDNIKDVIELAKRNGVGLFINNGCDNVSNKEVLKLTKEYKEIYGALGIHPENVLEYSEEDLKLVENNLNNEKIVAIGEIGLDYHYTKENKEEQKELFIKQIELASKYNMPIIVHSREATKDTLDILKKYKVRGVIHSFSGSKETAYEYIKMGYLLGVNGVVTFKNSHLKEVIQDIPLESILLETDSPYLTPEPFRGYTNNPSHIVTIAKFIADLKKVSEEEVKRVTNENVMKLFKINIE